MSAHTNWHMAAWRMAMAIGAIPILLFEPHLAAADIRQENAFLEVARSAAEKDDLQSLQAMESEALALSNSSAQRMGDRLVLRLRNGDARVFFDKPECNLPEVEAQCQKYRLIVHASARALFVIAKLTYEGAEYLVIDDAAGEETVFRNFPIFSPSGREAVVLLMNDELVGFAVQIWQREGRKFVREWEASPYADGMYTTYEVLGWNSEDQIEMQAETDFESKPPQRNMFRLKLGDSGWGIEEMH